MILNGIFNCNQPFIVPELREAFALKDVDFEKKYGFKKPSPDSKDLIVLGCKVGIRSAKAAQYLNELGFKNLRYVLTVSIVKININVIRFFSTKLCRNYVGSFNEWKLKEGTVVKP